MGTRITDRIPFILTALAFGTAVGAALTRVTGLDGLRPPADLWVAGTAVLGAFFARRSARRRAARLAATDPLRATPPESPRPPAGDQCRRSLWPGIRGALAVVGAVTLTTILVFTIGSYLLAPQIRRLFGADAVGLRGETVAEARADRARPHELDGYRTLKSFASDSAPDLPK